MFFENDLGLLRVQRSMYHINYIFIYTHISAFPIYLNFSQESCLLATILDINLRTACLLSVKSLDATSEILTLSPLAITFRMLVVVILFIILYFMINTHFFKCIITDIIPNATISYKKSLVERFISSTRLMLSLTLSRSKVAPQRCSYALKDAAKLASFLFSSKLF